jgi:predicted NBD/HSP70 family sugar kinase
MNAASGAQRPAGGSPGEVLALIRDRPATTRADLARLTGLARSTVSQRVDALIEHGLVSETADRESTGGRPPHRLRLRTEDNVVLGVDVGATHCRIALTDIEGTIVEVREDQLLVSKGPEAVLSHVDRRMHEMLTATNKPLTAVKAIGIGVPGPVEFDTGRAVRPPIMRGWDDYPIPEFFTKRYDLDVLVDNDVNVMALGEHRIARPDVRYLLFVKVGTGIGCGIITERQLHRGAQGCAGDIGHIRVPAAHDQPCHCGNRGCLEGIASGEAMARRLSELGHEASSGRDVVELVAAGNMHALQLVRESGRLIGEVIAGAVNLFNPQTIVFGGVLARVSEHLLAGVREVVHQRSLALAARSLEIVPARTAQDAAVLGAGILAIEHYLESHNVNLRLTAT